LVAARDRDWTYVRNVDTDAEELYYRPDDPTQQHDLTRRTADTRRAAAGEAHDRLAPVAREHGRTLQAGETDERASVDDELGARLEALGYR
jgi:hypothetical protein